MNQSFFIVGALLIGFSGLVFEFQDHDQMKETPSDFMSQKVDLVGEIVAGLAVEDFEQIKNASQRLVLLSHEAAWQVVTNAQYLKESSAFRTTVSRLQTAAEESNLDGATLAYFEMTMSCIRCHKQLRKEGADFSGLPGDDNR